MTMGKQIKIDYLSTAKLVLEDEGKAILHLNNVLDEKFNRLCENIQDSSGRVIFIGVGKSYIVGQKAAASMASLGTPALCVHASDAVHGDMGMVTKEDITILISHSGESKEIIYLLPFIKRIGTFTVALVGNPHSTLAKSCDMFLDTGVRNEASPIPYAPSVSTLTTQALCDGLAITLAIARGFNEKDFYHFHPGGHIGEVLSKKQQS